MYSDASVCMGPGEAGGILSTQRNLPPRSTLRNLKYRNAVIFRTVSKISPLFTPQSCRSKMEQVRRCSESGSGYSSEVLDFMQSI